MHRIKSRDLNMVLISGLIEYSCYTNDLGVGVLGQCNNFCFPVVTGVAVYVKHVSVYIALNSTFHGLELL
jgi:hypothetical protein